MSTSRSLLNTDWGTGRWFSCWYCYGPQSLAMAISQVRSVGSAALPDAEWLWDVCPHHLRRLGMTDGQLRLGYV